MAIYWLIKSLIWILSLILSPLLLLPVATLPSGITSALGQVGSITAIFNLVVPGLISELFSIIVLFVGIEGGIFLYKGIKWIYNKIPGVN